MSTCHCLYCHIQLSFKCENENKVDSRLWHFVSPQNRFNPSFIAVNQLFSEVTNAKWPMLKKKATWFFDTSVKVVCLTGILILKIIKEKQYLPGRLIFSVSIFQFRCQHINGQPLSVNVYEHMTLIHFLCGLSFLRNRRLHIVVSENCTRNNFKGKQANERSALLFDYLYHWWNFFSVQL